MKTTLVALIMCITFSMQLFASQDIIVDHSNKTVTILANFISSSPISKSMNKAADIWNSKSGKYHCEMLVDGKKVDYAIQFKLVVNQNPLSDTVVNVVAVLPNNHPFFKEKTFIDKNGVEQTNKVVGVTDGKTIAISSSHKNNKHMLAHEMGLAIGLTHKDSSKSRFVNVSGIENFELEKSVSNLAIHNGEKYKTTRKYIELGGSWSNFMAVK